MSFIIIKLVYYLVINYKRFLKTGFYFSLILKKLLKYNLSLTNFWFLPEDVSYHHALKTLKNKR